MKARIIFFLLVVLNGSMSMAQSTPVIIATDTTPYMDTSVSIPEVDVVRFKNKGEEDQYYHNIARIRVVLPYVRMAKRMYYDLHDKKDTMKHKAYRHYRKDMEQELRGKFEKELRDLSVTQGMTLVKLINRETGNNCYQIIKEVKGGFYAWIWQIVARKWDYDLKEKYDPKKEWVLELAIKALGPEYNPN